MLDSEEMTKSVAGISNRLATVEDKTDALAKAQEKANAGQRELRQRIAKIEADKKSTPNLGGRRPRPMGTNQDRGPPRVETPNLKWPAGSFFWRQLTQ